MMVVSEHQAVGTTLIMNVMVAAVEGQEAVEDQGTVAGMEVAEEIITVINEVMVVLEIVGEICKLNQAPQIGMFLSQEMIDWNSNYYFIIFIFHPKISGWGYCSSAYVCLSTFLFQIVQTFSFLTYYDQSFTHSHLLTAFYHL